MTENRLPTSDPQGNESKAARVAFVILAVLIFGGVVAAIVFRPGAGPPPEEIAGDPLLVQGRELYMSRCVSCHGSTGRGDGPIAAMVEPTKPGDLSDDRWSHGDRPEQVIGVIARGIPGTAMDGWERTFNAAEIRALAAYTYHLAGRDVPEVLREEGQEPAP